MKLLEFLSSLATDTDLMSAFRKSPQAALNSAGLNESEQRVLLAGGPPSGSFRRERNGCALADRESRSDGKSR